MAGQRLPHFCTSGWNRAGTAPLASATAPPPPDPASPAAAEYVPTTSSARKHMTMPTPMPPNTQNFRTPQPSPIGARFRCVFDGVYESSAAHHRRTRSTRGRRRLTTHTELTR